MDCIDLAFDSFLLSALRNHVKQVQYESKTVDIHICKLSVCHMYFRLLSSSVISCATFLVKLAVFK